MPTIRNRVFGPSGAKPPEKAPPEAMIRQMSKLFSQMLSQKPRKRFMFVEGKSFGRIHVNFRISGSAAIAIWVRMNEDGVKLDEKGVSVLLGKTGGPGEKKVMGELRRLAKRLTYPAKIYDAIEAESRPLAATIWFDRASIGDVAMGAAAEALAVAFFRPQLATE
jgi:hypothetical protein